MELLTTSVDFHFPLDKVMPVAMSGVVAACVEGFGSPDELLIWL